MIVFRKVNCPKMSYGVKCSSGVKRSSGVKLYPGVNAQGKTPPERPEHGHAALPPRLGETYGSLSLMEAVAGRTMHKHQSKIKRAVEHMNQARIALKTDGHGERPRRPRR